MNDVPADAPPEFPMPADAASQKLPPVPRRRRWPMVLLALAIFAAGAVCGAGATVIFVVNRVQHAIHHPEDAPARLAGVLQRRLDLTDAQRAEVDAIIAKRQTELLAIRREVQPQVADELEELRAEVDQVLTAEQREHWSKLFDTFIRRWLPQAPPPPAPVR
jgi:hypothetical protein